MNSIVFFWEFLPQLMNGFMSFGTVFEGFGASVPFLVFVFVAIRIRRKSLRIANIFYIVGLFFLVSSVYICINNVLSAWQLYSVSSARYIGDRMCYFLVLLVVGLSVSLYYHKTK